MTQDNAVPDTIEALARQLENPELTEREVDIIERKLKILEDISG